jgi:hypothetical protein
MNRGTDLRLRRLERVGTPGEIVSGVIIRARTGAEAEAETVPHAGERRTALRGSPDGPDGCS